MRGDGSSIFLHFECISCRLTRVVDEFLPTAFCTGRSEAMALPILAMILWGLLNEPPVCGKSPQCLQLRSHFDLVIHVCFFGMSA